MDIKKKYERWLANATADADVAVELKTLDDTKIEDAFYRDLAFGTGGLRGVIGAGTNRMNIYTVAKASQGLADYLKKNFETPSVGTYSPPIGFEKDRKELLKIAGMVKKASPDIFAVSLGSPKGEKFIYRHLKEYGVSLGISIGATIDFEAGNVKRAPKWMADHGLEWLFRITQDPKRLIKRYWNDAVNIVPIIRKYKNKG